MNVTLKRQQISKQIFTLSFFTKNSKTILFSLISVLYVVAVFNSNGFHHPDEHFQLIEVAGIRAGWNSVRDLAWEYDYQIRPTLQP